MDIRLRGVGSLVLCLVSGSFLAAADGTVQPTVITASSQDCCVPPSSITAYEPVVVGEPITTIVAAPAAPAYTPVPPPVLTPINTAPVVTFRPLLPIAPEPIEYQIGRGILGQPKVYVPGQPLRNFLRYLTP